MKKIEYFLIRTTIGRVIITIVGLPVYLALCHQYNFAIEYYIAAVLQSILFPLFGFFIAYRSNDSRKTELYINHTIGSLIFPFWIPVFNFNPIIILFVVYVTGLAAVSSGGMLTLLTRFIATGISILAGVLIFGFNFDSNISLIAFIYFSVIIVSISFYVTYMSYITTHNLRKIRKRLKYERNLLINSNEKMKNDLLLAEDIQRQLIPFEMPVDYISSIYKPMDEVGGDFYDFISFENSNKIGIFLSDVSGHGVPAALITTMIKTIILQAGDKLKEPVALLKYVDDVLSNHIGYNFVTVFYGIYDPDNRSLLYTNGGHCCPYIISNESVAILEGGRYRAIGSIFKNLHKGSSKTFISDEMIIPVNSKILFYTDGFIETMPVDGNIIFEQHNFEEKLIKNSALPCDLYVENLMEELINFRKDQTFDDDICLICLDVR